MSDEPRALRGILHSDDGDARPARFYVGEGEHLPVQDERICDDRHTRWIEDDGVIGIRRGASVTLGASAPYVAKYDEIDWGN